MITRLALAVVFLTASAAMFAHARTASGKAAGWRSPAILALIAGIGSLVLAAMHFFADR